MKVLSFGSFVRLIAFAMISWVLVGCGGGDPVSQEGVSQGVSLRAVEASTTVVADGVPTDAEVVTSIAVPSGLFVGADLDETIAVKPGTTAVTFVAFSRTEKYSEILWNANQAVTQLVFVNKTETNFAEAVLPWNLRFIYGSVDMAMADVYYYIETFHTELGSGMTVTFPFGWHGDVPLTDSLQPFRIEGSLSPTLVSGSIQLELVEVRTARAQARYDIASGGTRVIVFDQNAPPLNRKADGKG